MASATGPADARYETTAALAAVETSTPELQNTVERNAQKVHEAAEDAAKAAQHKPAATAVAVDNLEAGLAQKTNEAVAEGKANTQGYVQQARELAGSALATAAIYLPSSLSGTTSNGTTSTTADANGMANALSTAAGTAVETARSALNAVSNAAAPHVEAAKQAAQPHFDTTKATIQPHVDKLTGTATNTVKGASKPSDVPALTAPLESGNGHVGGPYVEGGKSNVGNL
ncbi:hypothetical protein BDY19DRAFT_901507 [Irpex rosettiformis]|uniref:Uncharacterized protein n=1 Tax=Irpex rosettiformis TaxID=378272 RepID=A0ACB8UIY4_9APHY|nr:hypothetical protein BDY19DRAFT_901507 [Irpex rosettiformis]